MLHDDFDRSAKKMFAGFGAFAIVAILLNIVFWLAIILGTLWGLDHFGVLDKF